LRRRARTSRRSLGLTTALDLAAFAESVGTEGAVTCLGSRSRCTAGAVAGDVDPGRVVSAPAGIVSYAADEMTLCCGAGTPVDEVQAELAASGQYVNLPAGGTVGGALAVGRADVWRLGRGPVRDALLQARVVTAAGEVMKAGGPTVKNVSGYDLCRLFVGSLGTLAFVGEVILRTRPRPAITRWFAGETDPFALRSRLYRPASMLWDGATTWICLEGHPRDVEDQAAIAGLAETSGPPVLPSGGRRSLPPASLRDLEGVFVAEVGVGVVHSASPAPVRAPDDAQRELHRRLKETFDPPHRLNPGYDPLAL
jgi:glycolate dehydrogenase FAD-binding subunit